MADAIAVLQSKQAVDKIFPGSQLMTSDLKHLLRNTPNSVPFRDFEFLDDIDLRSSCIHVLFVNIVGIDVDSADWLPNDDPPDLNERLAWIWFVRPSLANEIVEMISGDFRMLVECYQDDRMDDWWSHMTNA